MKSRRTLLGVVLGLAAAGVILSLAPAQRHRLPGGTILSECDGAIRELVIHYTPAAADVSAPIYRQFLPQLPSDVTVYAICPDAATFEDLSGRVGALRCRLVSVPVGHAMTTWSRDRWIALAGEGASAILLCPSGELAGEVWPDRAGDARTGEDLAAAVGGVSARDGGLFFDGGDFVTDADAAFVTPAVLRRNVQRTVRTPQELAIRLERSAGKKIILLTEAPDHHGGMFMMVAGENRVIVGDPAAAKALLSSRPAGQIDALCPPAGADFSEQTQQKFEAVARQCQAAGRRVIRIPIVPGRDGRTYLTYLNGIIDSRDGKRTVYMPTFQGVGELNRAAADVWRSEGFDVRPIDCTSSYQHFGSLHCLVNVLLRR
ncbi:MAG: hypothetical protein LLG01_19835 [Planctomycetaceae bacterium]|nr:hypothetical protein [Planctomycetaceae bacterium]